MNILKRSLKIVLNGLNVRLKASVSTALHPGKLTPGEKISEAPMNTRDSNIEVHSKGRECESQCECESVDRIQPAQENSSEGDNEHSDLVKSDEFLEELSDLHLQSY
jgi:hypothetical protein